MLSIRLITLLLLLGVCNSTAIHGQYFGSSHAALAEGSSTEKRLVAATRHSKLSKRAECLELSTSFDLEYIEAENPDGTNTFVTTVHIESYKPVLLLEDFEHLMQSLKCSNDKISITFPTLDYRSISTLDNLQGGIIVSSHGGCNEEDARSAFRVERYEASSDGRSFSLYVERLSWKTAFPVMSIKIRQTSGNSDYQPRRELLRRALNATGPSMFSTVSAPVPTSSVETSSASIPIATQILNEGLKVPDTPFNIGCNNCTTTGSVAVEYMDFDFRCQPEGFEDGLDIHDCIQGGGASIELNGFWAHVDLYTNLSQNWDFEASIYRRPLNYSLKLLGVGSASLVWEPFVIGGYQLNGSVEIDYGFELTVPDGAGLLFNLSDPEKSTQSKFNSTDGWNITALPFNASAAVDAITLTLGLRNVLGMSFHFDADLIPDMTGGAYLDFPVLSTKITPLQSVDANCQPLADSSAADGDVQERVLTDVYHIEPSASIDVGFYGEILDQDGTVSIYNNTDDPWPLPTACLNFDPNAKTYSAATAVVKAATGDGGGVVNPFSAQPLAVGTLFLAAAFLLV